MVNLFTVIAVETVCGPLVVHFCAITFFIPSHLVYTFIYVLSFPMLYTYVHYHRLLLHTCC